MNTATKMKPHYLKLARVVRDCGHNDEVQKSGEGNLIYDFQVVVDGEVRAIWKRVFSGKGYEIFTPAGDEISVEAQGSYYMSRPCKTDNLKSMEADTRSLLDDDRIPSIADQLTRKAGEARALEMAQDAELEQARDRAIGKFALELYSIVNAPRINEYKRDPLLARINAEIDRLQALTREHGEAFNNDSGYFDAARIWPWRF